VFESACPATAFTVDCATDCAASNIPGGAPGADATSAGADPLSLNCRVYHATVAASLGLNNAVHCPHAQLAATSQCANPAVAARTIAVDAIGAGQVDVYLIDGVSNGPLTLVRGGVYTFVLSNAAIHPFAIRVAANGANFDTGVVTNGATNGSVLFTVPASAPDTLVYQCVNHAAMLGTITVLDPPTTTTCAEYCAIFATSCPTADALYAGGCLSACALSGIPEGAANADAASAGADPLSLNCRVCAYSIALA
jgi:hypothetical protein